MPLRLCLHDRFSLIGPDGNDLTPTGSRKALGLFVLLATGPDLSRSRKFVQSLLWSDRSPEQQSASLRQMLSQIRRDLGDFEGALLASRTMLQLDSNMVTVDFGPADSEFLTDLETGDAMFEGWLRLERRRHLQRPISALNTEKPPALERQRPKILILRDPDQPAETALVTSLFADHLSRSLAEHFSVDIESVTPRSLSMKAPRDFVFSTEALVNSDFTAFRIALEAGPRRRRLWFGHQMADGPLSEETLDRDNLQRLVNEAVESYGEALLQDRDSSRDRLNASILARTSLRQIFSMRPELFSGADDLLDRAFHLDPRGIYLAWQVMLRIVQLVERHPIDAGQKAAEATELSRRAIEFEPLNSMVLAAASNVASLIEANPDAALELAQRSVRLNRANPFGWDCLSTAALHAGKMEEAHVFAVKAQRLAGDTPFKHWYDMGRALTATVTGRLEEAVGLAGAASVVPHFKPPLRYIAALRAHAGQEGLAQNAIKRLTALESDFSLTQMEEDPSYPVAALRRSEILRKGLFGSLR